MSSIYNLGAIFITHLTLPAWPYPVFGVNMSTELL